MKVMFYSPFAPADAGAASGASQMAMLLQRALTLGGASVSCPPLPLTREGSGDPEQQQRLKVLAEEAGRDLLVQIASGRMQRPDAWLSYHAYYKSPDWIGPLVCESLGVPYVIAEGSHAPKRAQGPWHLGHEGTTRALGAARLLLAMTAFDRYCLDQVARGRVHDLKPFIDAEAWRRPSSAQVFGGRLLSVGMMRDERKLESFRLARDVMKALPARGFTLDIAGDGKHRPAVEALFAHDGLGERVRFHGGLTPVALRGLMGGSDIFLWPGIGEAYGLTYLEAQASGLPVVACRNRGVDDVVLDGETGVLCAPGDVAGLASAVLALAGEPDRWIRMADCAQDFAQTERSLETASKRLMELMKAAVT